MSKLESYVPEFLNTNAIFKNLYNIQENELDKINYFAQDIEKQCFIDTATWGLALWEQFLNINTDVLKTYDSRRCVIKAKVRSNGTATVNMIRNVAESYENSTVNVIEHPENYSFCIKFITENGITNINDLEAAIEEIKPAHLAVVYEIIAVAKMNLYYAAVTLCGEKSIVYPWQARKIKTEGNINIAMSNTRDTETVSIHPKISKEEV